jgi:hypothetical protein
MTAAIDRRALMLAGLSGALAPTLAQAAPDPGAPIAAAALQGDVDILQRAFTALHPGLLRYNTPEEIADRFAALRRAFAAPKRLAEAHLSLARLTGTVRCGHTYLNPYNQEGASKALIAGGRSRLPFNFAWIERRMIVIEPSPAHPALVRGAEVTAIGGAPVGAILDQLLPFAPADGHNDAKRVRLMEVRGEDEWELFDIYFALLRPDLVRDGTADLTMRGPDGAERRVRVQLLTRAERTAGVKPGVVTRGGAEPAWRMERLANGAGFITMRSWALYDSKWDWRAALNADLDVLADERAPGLILDLRGNGGGLDCGDVILSRLVDRDVRQSDLQRFVRYRRTPADLDRYLDTWDNSFRDWGAAAKGPDAQGFYRLVRYDDDAAGDLIRPSGKRFKGKVIALIDASNSSATFNFAETLKTNGLGVLVGGTTGGSRRGINGGAFFFLRLPGSGLEVDVPLIATFPTRPQPDAGVEPDVRALPTEQGIAAGRDPARTAALALLGA